MEGTRTGVRVVRRTGKLRQLVDGIPLELITEICCFLHPRSLLSLARAAKMFARLLLKPQRSWVWRVSRENHTPDLPLIHEDLTEQQYAVLAFGTVCQRCGVTTTLRVLWCLRRRWCRKCQGQLPHSGFCELYIGRYARKHEESSRLVLHQETMKRHLANVTICPVDEFEDLKIKLNTLSDVEWDGFVSRSLAEREALEVHAKSCDDWCQLRVHERGKELCSLKQGRLVSIRERLKGLGFCDAVLADDVILRIPGANRGKPLTEREWLAMKDKAFDAATNQVTLVKSLTRTRTEKIIAKEYTAWYGSCSSGDEVWPTPVQFLHLSVVKDAVRAVELDFDRLRTDGDPRDSHDSLSSLISQFQLLASEYSRDVMQKLFSKVPNHLRRSTPESTLALACVAFELSGGNAWRIAHLGSALLCKVLDIDDWTFAASASGVISDVIRRSGWDPSQMTLAELERENIRIQCASCVGTDGTMPTMTWRGSVHHFREKHSHVSPADWRILFGTEKERYIMEVETPELKRKNLRYDWTCLLCRDILSGWSYSERAMLLHIAHAHSSTRTNLQRCYMQDLDLAPETNVSALWNPDS